MSPWPQRRDELVARAKDELRRAARRIRDAIPPDRALSAARAAAAHLLDIPAVRAARTVALYAPLPGELDTTPAAEALGRRGVRIAYPRVITSEKRLSFHEIAVPARDLSPGAFGIPEPTSEPEAAGLPVDHIDLYVLPGLAFDRTGTRLGWGHGYYDRTLAAHPAAVRVGYCFACQVTGRVPRGPDDLPVHFLVTEDGALECTGAAAGDASPSSSPPSHSSSDPDSP